MVHLADSSYPSFVLCVKESLRKRTTLEANQELCCGSWPSGGWVLYGCCSSFDVSLSLVQADAVAAEAALEEAVREANEKAEVKWTKKMADLQVLLDLK